MSEQDVRWFRTADHYWFAVFVGGWFIGIIALWMLGLPGFPVGSQRFPILIAGATLSLVLLIAILSQVTVLRVGIMQNGIVLRRPFSSLVIYRTQVDHVFLNPPVDDMEKGVAWWHPGSNLTIHLRKNPKPMPLPNLPEGLKLRIALTLDPESCSDDAIRGD